MLVDEEFQIHSNPGSLLYLRDLFCPASCNKQFQLTGYRPLIHNVGHNSKSVMLHDVLWHQHISSWMYCYWRMSLYFPFKIKPFAAVHFCAYCTNYTEQGYPKTIWTTFYRGYLEPILTWTPTRRNNSNTQAIDTKFLRSTEVGKQEETELEMKFLVKKL
jgi:hypothetical protein